MCPYLIILVTFGLKGVEFANGVAVTSLLWGREMKGGGVDITAKIYS